MHRIRLSNLITALMLVVAFSAVSSALADIKRVVSGEAMLPVEEPAMESEMETFRLSDQQPAVAPEIDTLPTLPPPATTRSTDAGVQPPPGVTRTPEPSPSPTPTLPPGKPEDPVRLVIPAIHLDAPVVMAKVYADKVGKKSYLQWKVPNRFAVGWHEGTARLGEIGNTVFNGHHNVHGEVFRHLVDLEPGDLIQVYSQESIFTYEIANKMILPEKYQVLDVRMNNAQWILPSDDERITLITCWPYKSNTHRLILVARPIGREPIPHQTVNE